MMFLRLSFCLVALVGLFGLAGCQSGPKLSQLIVVVAALEPAGERPTLTLRYVNENTLPIAIARTEHVLTLNGVKLDRIKAPDPVGLPELGTEIQVIPLSGEVLAQVRAVAQNSSGAVTYEINSRLILLDGEGDELKLKARRSGRVTLGVPAASVGAGGAVR